MNAQAPCRWEWRMFAPSLADLQSKIGTAANVPASESTEIYLLGTRNDLNIKVRNDTLELKRLDQTDENGLELWRPEGKERFPVSTESAAKLLAPFRRNFTFQGAITVEAFLSTSRQPASCKSSTSRSRDAVSLIKDAWRSLPRSLRTGGLAKAFASRVKTAKSCSPPSKTSTSRRRPM